MIRKTYFTSFFVVLAALYRADYFSTKECVSSNALLGIVYKRGDYLTINASWGETGCLYQAAGIRGYNLYIVKASTGVAGNAGLRK